MPLPAELADQAAERRSELVEKLADVDEQLGELFLMEEPIDEHALRAAIRRATISLHFVPIFMGSAYKNKGVQLLLDGVTDYLPSPAQVQNTALVRNACCPFLLQQLLCPGDVQLLIVRGITELQLATIISSPCPWQCGLFFHRNVLQSDQGEKHWGDAHTFTLTWVLCAGCSKR